MQLYLEFCQMDQPVIPGQKLVFSMQLPIKANLNIQKTGLLL
ncbi:uncharacterized protein METZ01_LOCUS55487 [marine metagenome]|uniref:Uncharacterized protein n=1 Tax=marine metagenome TaxID=408172 RepID=A0A381SMV7_9ZZZZ